MKSKHFAELTLAAMAILTAGATADPAQAQVSVQVGIALPPPMVFVAPPQVVVFPGSNIYVAADLADDFYFVDGFWWRPWQGRWYRSRSYNSGWAYYDNVPSFYGSVRSDWRRQYRDRQWDGRAWDYEHVSQDRVEQNWSSWKSNDHWKNKGKANAPGLASKQRAPQRSGKVQAPRSSGKSPAQRSHKQVSRSAPAQQQQSQPSKGGQASKGPSDKGNGKNKGSSGHGGGKGGK